MRRRGITILGLVIFALVATGAHVGQYARLYDHAMYWPYNVSRAPARVAEVEELAKGAPREYDEIWDVHFRTVRIDRGGVAFDALLYDKNADGERHEVLGRNMSFRHHRILLSHLLSTGLGAPALGLGRQHQWDHAMARRPQTSPSGL